MPLRLKLLLIAMVAAVFPLAGWRFVVQMETTLRQSQERTLVATARTLASTIPAAEARLRALRSAAVQDVEPYGSKDLRRGIQPNYHRGCRKTGRL